MNNRAFAILALFLAAGVFFTYINPLWTGKIAETKLAIANIDEALEAAQEYKTRQDQLVVARDSIDPQNLERLDTFLPDSVANVGLILDLNALAARSGFSLSSIDVSAGSAAAPRSTGAKIDPVGSIDMSLTAVGTYAAFQNFMRGIEQSQRLLDVRNVTVTGSNSGLYSYQMLVRLYWLR